MRIAVDREACIGSGNCARLLPEIFDQDDSGLVTLLDADPGAVIGRVTEVGKICPVGAVHVSSEEAP